MSRSSPKEVFNSVSDVHTFLSCCILPQKKCRKREQSVLCNAIWNPWPHSSSCTIQKPKEEEQKAPTKKHFLIMLLWPFRVTDTSLESCAEKQEYIWSYITSGSALCFPFWVTIKLSALELISHFQILVIKGNLPCLIFYMQKIKEDHLHPEQSSQKGTRVSKASVCFQILINDTISKYMFYRQVKKGILFCGVDKRSIRYLPLTGTALKGKVWLEKQMWWFLAVPLGWIFFSLP